MNQDDFEIPCLGFHLKIKTTKYFKYLFYFPCLVQKDWSDNHSLEAMAVMQARTFVEQDALALVFL